MTMTFRTSVAIATIGCLAGVCPAAAQVQRGAIYGTAYDGTRAVLPGVVIQLSSELTAVRETTSDGRGEFRFPDLDPGRYTLRAVLPGFASIVRDNVIVGVGTTVSIGMELAVAGVSAEVVVSAATPVLDVRRQGNVTNFDQVMLNEIPTARDPWAFMQHLPGVSIGRPNVGGSESTNQAQFAARGDNGSNTMWNIDGVTVTDMAAVGASLTYYDFNVFEEVQFTTGGLDSRQHTGGLGINLVSKRGTNALRAAGRLYFTNDRLQGENITSELKAAGLSGNRIRQLAEYGADAGGPVLPGRLWFWVAASRNDVRQLAINGFPDTSVINTVASKLDSQIGGATRFSFLQHRAEKLKVGRAAGVDRPPETTTNQSGPGHIYKVEASRVFEPAIFLSGKWAYVGGHFSLTPQAGPNAQVYRDLATQIWHGGFQLFSSSRAQYQLQIDGDWSRGRHEVKFGFHHRQTTSDETARWPGDGTLTLINAEQIGVPTGFGFANLTRPSAVSSGTRALSFYAGDVLAADRWTFDLGMRFDRQRVRNDASEAPANGLAAAILPALSYAGGQYRTWSTVSPRLGATVRLTENTIARASYARFGNQLGSNVAVFENPAQLATIQYLFQDVNGDRLAQASELVSPTGFVMGVNPAAPAAPYAPNTVDASLTSPRTQAFVGGVEREVMPNFSVSVNLGHGHVSNTIWTPFIGLTRDDFVEYRTAGTGSVTSSTPVYELRPDVRLPPGNGRVMINREGYHRRYWNVDMVATKRLANRWMFRGFVTLQRDNEYFDDPARSTQDPTPRLEFFPPFVSGFVDGGISVNVYSFQPSEFLIHSKWNYSLAGLHELPWDASVAATVYGRQGYPRGEVISVNRPDGLGVTAVFVDRDLDSNRFPSVHLLDVRLQKRLELGRARATLNLDVFNALNRASTLRQFTEATATTFGRPLEIVAPRLLRLGLQLQF